MKKKVLIVLIAIVCLAQGCIVSTLHPLYSPDTITYDARLLGKWIVDEHSFWEFKKADQEKHLIETVNDYYEVTYSEKGVVNKFEVRLIKLKDYYYLDFFPVESGDKFEDLYWLLHLIPTHTFLRVDIQEETLKVLFFNEDWISEQIKNRYIRIKHERLQGDRILITASTTELQKFIIKYADHSTGKERAFYEPDVWKKENK